MTWSGGDRSITASGASKRGVPQTTSRRRGWAGCERSDHPLSAEPTPLFLGVVAGKSPQDEALRLKFVQQWSQHMAPGVVDQPRAPRMRCLGPWPTRSMGWPVTRSRISHTADCSLPRTNGAPYLSVPSQDDSAGQKMDMLWAETPFQHCPSVRHATTRFASEVGRSDTLSLSE